MVGPRAWCCRYLRSWRVSKESLSRMEWHWMIIPSCPCKKPILKSRKAALARCNGLLANDALRTMHLGLKPRNNIGMWVGHNGTVTPSPPSHQESPATETTDVYRSGVFWYDKSTLGEVCSLSPVPQWGRTDSEEPQAPKKSEPTVRCRLTRLG